MKNEKNEKPLIIIETESVIIQLVEFDACKDCEGCGNCKKEKVKQEVK